MPAHLRFRRSIQLNTQSGSSSAMSDIFGRQLRKQTARAKEKLLEGLGKAKATQDDVFDQHASNLNKQTKACDRLQRDLKAYGVALKAMVQAQKTLRETIRELYETDWPDREHVCAITQSLDLQWDDFEKIVNEQLMGSVNGYMAQFVDLKAKVAKRGRKLVDFDSARNNYNTVRASSKKGDEDPKVVKAAADLQQAETMYKDLNKELVDTLPATYDSRITFFVDTLQTFFNAESANHTECAKYNKTLVTHLDSLGNAFDSLRVPRPESTEPSPVALNLSNGGANQSQRESIVSMGATNPNRPSPPLNHPASSPPAPPPAVVPSTESHKPDTASEEKMQNQSLNASPESVAAKETKESVQAKPKATEKPDEAGERTSQNPFDENADTASTNPFDEPEEQQTTPIPKSRSVDVVQDSIQGASEPTGTRKVLYKVRATHHYAAEDTDELTFDAGEVIAVLESKEEDLLDDGWLLGVKQSDGVQGVFPANFTKQI